MNEELKDRGLKKAVREQTTFRLPSNFTYRTMQKVEEAIRLREKKSERRILLATIAAAIFLIGVSGARIGSVLRRQHPGSLYAHHPPTVRKYPDSLLLSPTDSDHSAFHLFDRWMRKLYFKHHTPKLPEF